MNVPEICPKCGGTIQATEVQERYFNLEDGTFCQTWMESEIVDVRFYCENDCEEPFTDDERDALLRVNRVY